MPAAAKIKTLLDSTDSNIEKQKREMDPSYWIVSTVVVFMGMPLPIIAIVTKHKGSNEAIGIRSRADQNRIADGR